MDPFAVLGIAPTTSEVLIRAAYRRRARVLHPDMRAARGNDGRDRADHEEFCRLDEALRLALVSARYSVHEPRSSESATLNAPARPARPVTPAARVPRQRQHTDLRVPGQRSAQAHGRRRAGTAASAARIGRTDRVTAEAPPEWSVPLLLLVVGLMALLVAVVVTTSLPGATGL